LLHAGRQVRLGPIAFWVAVGTLVIMAGWTITTGTYFAFREDVLTRLLARQAEMQFAYEDRIAELRAQVDRISSRQLLDQEQYEQKLGEVQRRQSALESRASALHGLPDPVSTGSIKPAARPGTGAEPSRGGAFKPSPINDIAPPEAPKQREAGLLPTIFSGRPANSGGFDAAIERLHASLDRVEARQGATLSSLEESYDAKARRIRGVLGELGLNTNKIAPPQATGAVGGPFIAPRLRNDANAFERQVQRISAARAQLDRLTRTIGSVPVRRPVTGEIDAVSGFGVRIDPFIRAPAMHTGLDLRADHGEPVRATANGTVTTAGWNGGYGKLVEVDHGNGFATRYGHLSSIDVQVGQVVRTGQVVGKVGSTGRSTGPHLHYETRVDGEAVDPHKFLRAGARLGSVL
jgi:murein DD-endopeptidase MepM/ murein hydrolase activator NlpD